MLAFDTAEVLAAAGGEVLFCDFNDAFLDRSAAGPGRRLRHRGDHRPLDGWRDGDRPAEIAIARGLPAGIGFEVLS